MLSNLRLKFVLSVIVMTIGILEYSSKFKYCAINNVFLGDNMNLSIVIINYNTKRLTSQCINAILKTVKNLNYEIIVIDNSTNSREKYVASKSSKINISVIQTDNKGFANACNIGASHALGTYLLFLNSDTLVHKDAIDKSFAFLSNNSNIGILGIRTLLKNGTLDHGCKRGFPTPSAAMYYFLGLDKKYPTNQKIGAYRQTFINEFTTSDVDVVSGSFMMLRRTFFFEINGFDEDYFMYGEDIDICFKAKLTGKRVVYFADASITHLKGQSGLHTKSKKTIKYFHKSMQLFYKKHYAEKHTPLLNGLVYLGIHLKYFFTLVLRKLK